MQQPLVRPIATVARAGRGHRRRFLVLATLALSITSIGAGAFSLALFTDQETVDGTFSTGTIILDDVKIDALSLTTSNMMPGDSVTDDVVVENDGSAQLRYSVTATSTNPDTKNLRSVLTLTVRTIDATTPATPCNDFDGTQLFTGTLGASTTIVGDPATGVQGGERNLNGTANETLCFRVSLPIGTGNPFQGATATTTFIFDAEQTANNP
jgi:predicted ribosomally synthesized peptide with SipW-like signal peptide